MPLRKKLTNIRVTEAKSPYNPQQYRMKLLVRPMPKVEELW